MKRCNKRSKPRCTLKCKWYQKGTWRNRGLKFVRVPVGRVYLESDGKERAAGVETVLSEASTEWVQSPVDRQHQIDFGANWRQYVSIHRRIECSTGHDAPNSYEILISIVISQPAEVVPLSDADLLPQFFSKVFSLARNRLQHAEPRRSSGPRLL
jgi:hypothetical protein